MKISLVTEADVPVEFAFSNLTNFETISSKLPEYVNFRSSSGDDEFSKGSVWILRTMRAGRTIVIETTVIHRDENKGLKLKSEGKRLEFKSHINFEAISADMCRVSFETELKPKGILGRILLQSIKASKTRINNRIMDGSDRLATFLEQQYEAQKD